MPRRSRRYRDDGPIDVNVTHQNKGCFGAAFGAGCGVMAAIGVGAVLVVALFLACCVAVFESGRPPTGSQPAGAGAPQPAPVQPVK